ncbi:hypothetical protein Q8A73_013434 [Channa argus]|nr:hypothetical protein Q8A73_013434 [Channa argus]
MDATEAFLLSLEYRPNLENLPSINFIEFSGSRLAIPSRPLGTRQPQSKPQSLNQPQAPALRVSSVVGGSKLPLRRLPPSGSTTPPQSLPPSRSKPPPQLPFRSGSTPPTLPRGSPSGSPRSTLQLRCSFQSESTQSAIQGVQSKPTQPMGIMSRQLVQFLFLSLFVLFLFFQILSSWGVRTVCGGGRKDKTPPSPHPVFNHSWTAAKTTHIYALTSAGAEEVPEGALETVDVGCLSSLRSCICSPSSILLLLILRPHPSPLRPPSPPLTDRLASAEFSPISMRKAAVGERVKPGYETPKSSANFLPCGGVGEAGSGNKDARGRSGDSGFTICTCGLKSRGQCASETANYERAIHPLSLRGTWGREGTGGEGDGETITSSHPGKTPMFCR